jgi:hypothetical protein
MVEMGLSRGIRPELEAEVLAGQEAQDRAEQLEPVIRDLQKNADSLNRIAAELNPRKVPTPRGGRWDHSSVRNVLQRLAP